LFYLIDKKKWENAKLTAFSIKKAGDKKGSMYSASLKICEKNVILTIEIKKYFDQIPEISEYIADENSLLEIKEIFTDNKMYRWRNKKFSNLQIADRDSTRYTFIFDDDEISFSSQIYPKKYEDALDRLHMVIEKNKTNIRKSL